MLTEAGEANSSHKGWQLWQEESHPVELRSKEMFGPRMAYLHRNPVRAGYVEEPWQWRYSSARDFEGMKGMLDLQMPWEPHEGQEEAEAQLAAASRAGRMERERLR